MLYFLRPLCLFVRRLWEPLCPLTVFRSPSTAPLLKVILFFCPGYPRFYGQCITATGSFVRLVPMIGRMCTLPPFSSHSLEVPARPSTLPRPWPPFHSDKDPPAEDSSWPHHPSFFFLSFFIFCNSDSFFPCPTPDSQLLL